jgi:hypothetical protein
MGLMEVVEWREGKYVFAMNHPLEGGSRAYV